MWSCLKHGCVSIGSGVLACAAGMPTNYNVPEEINSLVIRCYYWNYIANCNKAKGMHTVSVNWFLYGLEWILNLEFRLLKLLIFYQKLVWNMRSRLSISTFWVFEPCIQACLTKIFIFCAKSFNFDKTYLNTGLKIKMWKSYA